MKNKNTLLLTNHLSTNAGGGGGGVGGARGGGLTWTSDKPSSETSGYGLNTVNFLFGSCASCLNVIN